MLTIGVLAIQGSVIEHVNALKRAAAASQLRCDVTEVRTVQDVCKKNGELKISGIILPGGESTTQSLLLQRFGLFDVLKGAIEKGLPVWGTCAGAILLAKKVSGKNAPKTLAVMDIEADRNAYGSQLDSFDTEITLNLPLAKPHTMRPAFIRAPKLKPLSKKVQIIATLQGKPVGFLQNHMLATAFHPELTDDTMGVSLWFLIKMCAHF